MSLRRWRHRTRATPPVGVGPLADVTRYRISAHVLDRTLNAISEAGAEGDELFMAWGARVDGDLASIESTIIPAQRCLHTPDGLLVLIEGDALFELNKELFQRGEILTGQAHGHPTTAYHSAADDDLAIVTAPGGISLVIPDFGAHGQRGLKSWKWFRRSLTDGWNPLPIGALELP